MEDRYRSELLTDTKRCYRYLQAGLGVISVTFVAGLAVLAVPDLNDIYDVMVMPSLFVGLGLLLFGVGTHLHVMHLNVVRMLESDDEEK